MAGQRHPYEISTVNVGVSHAAQRHPEPMAGDIVSL
jgi:hypothetical protein